MSFREAVSRRSLSLALCAVLSTLALSGLGTPAVAQRVIGDRAAEALSLRAQARGGIRVIVGLDMPAPPEDAPAAAWSEPNRAAIRTAQERVIAGLREAGLQGGTLQDGSLREGGPRNGLSRDDATLVRRLETVPYMALQVSPAQLRALQADPRVTSVFEDVPVPPALNTSTIQIGARSMWQRGFTGSDWAVAVLDTGISYRHRAFSGALLNSACYSSNDPFYNATSLCRNGAPAAIGPRAAPTCALSIDGCGHGTHVAGTVMGHFPRRLRGVAPAARVIPVQVFSLFPPESGLCINFGAPCVLSFFSDQLAGLERIADMAQRINIAAVNLSLGGGYFTSACDDEFPAYTAMVDNLTAMGIAVIASSGNSGYRSAVTFPACISNVIAVGATNSAGRIASFSNQSAQMTALMAPGVAIEAAFDGGPRATATMNGTSMAAPHVAGAFALLRQASPHVGVATILAALRCTGTPVRRPGTAGSFPRINVNAARLELLWSRRPTC